MSAPSRDRHRVPPTLAGARLDRALVELLRGWSRSRVQASIRAGRVRVGGRVEQKPGRCLDGGEEIEVELQGPPAAPTAEQSRELLPILHADGHLAAVDKPAGVLSHRGEGSLEPTVSELAAALLGPLPSLEGEERPGIVHRLDRETSGVMVLARTVAALSELQRQFRERVVEKTYFALVHGEPRFDSDWIEAPLARAPGRAGRVAVMPRGEGREASTYYEVRERYGALSLLACRPRTGRMHQVRVHLSSIGHPLVGEALYRRRNVPRRPLPADAPPADRHLLHSAELRLRHPASGAELHFEAPLPADFERWLAWLRAPRG